MEPRDLGNPSTNDYFAKSDSELLRKLYEAVKGDRSIPDSEKDLIRQILQVRTSQSNTLVSKNLARATWFLVAATLIMSISAILPIVYSNEVGRYSFQAIAGNGHEKVLMMDTKTSTVYQRAVIQSPSHPPHKDWITPED